MTRPLHRVLTAPLHAALLLGLAPSAWAQAPAGPGWRTQVLDAGGTPAADRELLAHTFGADGRSHDLQRVTTDGEGRLAVALPAAWSDRAIGAVFVKTMDVTAAGWLVVGAAAQASPSPGPLALTPPADLLEGTVTGFRPIPDDLAFDALDSIPDRQVTLWPEYRLPGADDGRWRWIDGGAAVDRVPTRDGGYEIRCPSMRMTWRADGGFEARGWAPPGPMRLQVRSRWHLPHEPIPFVPGGEPLAIEVHKGGAIRARIALPQLDGDDALRPHAWLVPRVVCADPDVNLIDGDVEPGDPAGDRGLPRSTEPGRKDGFMRYDWPSLPGGNYRLEIRTWGGSEPIATIDDITVTEPYLVDDPRLATIDLREALEILEVRVRSEGSDLAERSGFVAIPGPDGAAAFRLEEGVARILASGPVALLEIHVAGCQPARARDLAASTIVDLQPGPAVVIGVDEPQTLPADGILEAVLSPTEADSVAARARLPLAAGGGPPEPLEVVVPIGDLRSARGHVSSAGSYRVHLRLKDRRYGDWIDLEGSERTLEVPQGGLEEPAILELPAAALREAIERMRL